MMYRLLYGLWYLLSLLPFCVHYVLSDLIYLILYKMLGYRKKIVRKNLATSFPEKSETELRTIERRFYHCLCDYFGITREKAEEMIEKFKSMGCSLF